MSIEDLAFHRATRDALKDANRPDPQPDLSATAVAILTPDEARALRGVLERLLADDYASAATLSRAQRIPLIAAHAKIAVD